MKKMKKIVVGIVSLICVLALTAGCTTHASLAYTFSIDNGDAIKVSLDIKGKYKITSDVPFTISCNGEDLTQGTFIHGEYYEQYVNAVQNDEKAVLLDSGEKDGNQYIFWSFDGKEYNYAVLVTGSNTGLILSNHVSEESARECFNRLTISKE